MIHITAVAKYKPCSVSHRFLTSRTASIQHLEKLGTFPPGSLVTFVYLSSLPVAHLNDAPRRRLVVTGDSARIQDETAENSAWFFNVLGV